MFFVRAPPMKFPFLPMEMKEEEGSILVGFCQPRKKGTTFFILQAKNKERTLAGAHHKKKDRKSESKPQKE